MKTIKFYAMAILAISMLASCSDDDDSSGGEVDEEEAITQLVLTFSNADPAINDVILFWNDDNGDEIVDDNEKTVTGTFVVNETYNAEIALGAEGEDFLEEDILSDQVLGIDAHFFVYGTDLGFSMNRNDVANGVPARSDGFLLGVHSVWVAPAAAANGSISVQLWHEAPTVDDSDGFGSAMGDETDIDIAFNVAVQ